jgi:hypothetical protein
VTRRFASIGVALAALVLPASAQADYKKCRPVVNILDGTRYAGSDLYRIRAQGVSCKTARRVAYRGTLRGVAGVPDENGRVVVGYRAWLVIGDLRGDADRYEAQADWPKRVRWVFGEIP